MKSWQLLITNMAEVILFINIVLSLIYFWNRSNLLRIFSLLLIFSSIIQVVAKVMWLQKMNNLPLLHFYTLGEFIIISLVYREIFSKNRFWQSYIFWHIGIVSSLIIANSIFFQPITVFNSNAKTLTQVIYMVYAISYFMQANYNAQHHVIKIINSAILLYYTGSLFIFMFSNVLLGLEQRHNLFWVANALLYLIFQLLVFTAIWQFRQTKSTYS